MITWSKIKQSFHSRLSYSIFTEYLAFFRAYIKRASSKVLVPTRAKTSDINIGSNIKKLGKILNK